MSGKYEKFGDSFTDLFLIRFTYYRIMPKAQF